MKLLGSDTSPYTRKARLVLLEKGIPHQYVVAPPRDPGSPVPHANPLARIPTLLLDDGSAVFDSTVICEYADALGGGPALIPAEREARMRVRRWEALADGIMDSAVVVRLESLRPPEKQDPATLALHDAAIGRALAHAAAALGGGRDFLEGGACTLADLALLAALVYLDLRQPGRDWRGAHPALARFDAAMRARPAAKAALPG